MEVSRKPLIVLFTAIHIICGLDFGYIKRDKPSTVLTIRILTIVQSIFICVYQMRYYMSYRDIFVAVWVTIAGVLCFMNSILLIINNKSIVTMKKGFIPIDSRLNSELQSKTRNSLFLITLLIILLRIIYHCLVCFSTYLCRSVTGSFLWFYQLLTFDVTLVVYQFVFYSAYCRIKVLKGLLEYDVGHSIQYLHLYKDIADVIDEVKKVYDYSYLLALLYKTPDGLLCIYLTLLDINATGETVFSMKYITQNAYFIISFLILFAPPIYAGFLASRVKELEILLHERLLQERDEKHVGDIELFMEYVKGRPLRLTLFQVVPLDWSLPVTIVNICVTYQILIVQLTNML